MRFKLLHLMPRIWFYKHEHEEVEEEREEEKREGEGIVMNSETTTSLGRAISDEMENEMVTKRCSSSNSSSSNRSSSSRRRRGIIIGNHQHRPSPLKLVKSVDTEDECNGGGRNRKKGAAAAAVGNGNGGMKAAAAAAQDEGRQRRLQVCTVVDAGCACRATMSSSSTASSSSSYSSSSSSSNSSRQKRQPTMKGSGSERRRETTLTSISTSSSSSPPPPPPPNIVKSRGPNPGSSQAPWVLQNAMDREVANVKVMDGGADEISHAHRLSSRGDDNSSKAAELEWRPRNIARSESSKTNRKQNVAVVDRQKFEEEFNVKQTRAEEPVVGVVYEGSSSSCCLSSSSSSTLFNTHTHTHTNTMSSSNATATAASSEMEHEVYPDTVMPHRSSYDRKTLVNINNRSNHLMKEVTDTTPHHHHHHHHHLLLPSVHDLGHEYVSGKSKNEHGAEGTLSHEAYELACFQEFVSDYSRPLRGETPHERRTEILAREDTRTRPNSSNSLPKTARRANVSDLFSKEEGGANREGMDTRGRFNQTEEEEHDVIRKLQEQRVTEPRVGQVGMDKRRGRRCNERMYDVEVEKQSCDIQIPKGYGGDNNSSGRTDDDPDGLDTMSMSCREGAVAMVKSSFDPRKDFKKSMAEMVLAKGLRGHDQLQELLQCYLSLNPHKYRNTIIDVFRELCCEILQPSP